MLAIRTLAAVSILLLLSSVATPLAAQERLADDAPALSNVGDHFILRVDQEHGTPLIDLLALFEKLLGTPISYSPLAVADVRVRMMGSLEVSRDGLRKLLDTLIQPHGLVSWDAAPGDDPMITIASAGRGRSGPSRRLARQVIQLADLDRDPQRITALYTAVFPLKYADSRSAMSSLTPFLESDGEMVRAVEPGNLMIITASSMETLRELRDLIVLLDVESITQGAAAPLEQRVAQLEAMVATLEATLAEMKDGER